MATTEELYSQLAQLIGSDNVNNFVKLTGIPTHSSIIIIAVLLVAIFVWSFVWSAIALWVSAKKNHKFWFILFLILVLLQVVTGGILEILYVYVFSKVDWKKLFSKDKPVRLNKSFNTNKTNKKKKR